jgi:hypothetical protein
MNKPLLVFQAPVATRSGYGDHARDILKSLFALDKFEIQILPTRWGATPQNQLNADKELDKKILGAITMQLTKQPDVFIQLSVANEFKPIGKYNIGITAGVETTIVPDDFLSAGNQMDLIIVPSEFTKKGFVDTIFDQIDQRTKQKNGELRLQKPIEVLFEGIDTEVFNGKSNDSLSPIKNIETDFNFLYMGHWLNGVVGEDRKDVGMLIKTFASVFKSFPKDKQPGLILKTSSAGFSIIEREEIYTKIKEVTKEYGDVCPPIYFLYGDLSQEEINALYNDDKVKAFAMFTKGEGYGRPLAEFATTDKPILVSDWSGHKDFLPKEHTIFLQGDLTNIHPSSQNKFLIPEAKWFTVNYSKAAQKMMDVFQNYPKYLSQSKGLAKNIKDNFSMEAQHKRVEEIFDQYVKVQQRVELKLPEIKKL